MEKLALEEPADTVTLDETVAADVLLELRLTTAPPAGAGPSRVTVPCDEVPPVTLVGFSDTPDTAGASTVNVAALLTEL
jgi:hypothetical protein